MLARSATLAVRAGAAAAGLAAVIAVGLTGCGATPAAAAPPIEIGTSYMPVPASAGNTVAYVVIRNNGAADRLVAARTSAGGQVAFRAPAGPSDLAMHTIGSIAIPAHSTVRMVPDGYHMLITGAGPIRGGKDVTLTLVFAHAGRVPVVVQVTNPATGGSTYFLN
jgi:periplasmic copper chaperone A